MAARVLANLLVAGAGVLIRAGTQAYKQALINASKTGAAADVASSAATKAGMALDEAHKILGTAPTASREELLRRATHLFRANDEAGSFYLTSKVFRARERIEAELRDLVACPDAEGELYLVRHCATLRYDVVGGKSAVVQALPFAPTSFTVGSGIIAAGGQHGQLDVRRLADGEALIRGASGGSVNNALALAPAAGPGGTPLLFASNNDCTVRVFALPPPRGPRVQADDEDGENEAPSTSGRGEGAGGGEEAEEEEEEESCMEAEGWAAAPPPRETDENDARAANDAMEEDDREYDDDGWGAAASPRDRLLGRRAQQRQARGRAAPTATTSARARRPSTAEASRSARARAGAPLAIVRCLDPVNYCAVGPAGFGGGARAADGPGGGGAGGGGRDPAAEASPTASTPAAGLLATVGDCPTVTLHAPAEAAYVPSASWDVFDDAGMAAAWAPSGGLLAAAGQDGAVVALDPRARAPTARVRTRGAARALKFAPGPADLLAVTEHDSAIHVLDARTWGSAQVVRFGGADGGPRHVSGAAFSPGTGAKLYVGLEGAGVAQFSVDVSGRCCVAEWGAR